MKNVALYGRTKDGKFIMVDLDQMPAKKKRDWFPWAISIIALLVFVALAIAVFAP